MTFVEATRPSRAFRPHVWQELDRDIYTCFTRRAFLGVSPIRVKRDVDGTLVVTCLFAGNRYYVNTQP